MSELNLIPYSLRQKNRKRWMLIKVLLAVVVIAVILGIGVYLPNSILGNLKDRENTLRTDINNLSSVRTENGRLLSETAALKEFQSIIEIIKASNISIYKVLTGMEQYIPGDLVVNNYTYTAGKLAVSGICKQYNSINEFQASLEESGKYQNVSMTSVTCNDATGEWTFTLTIDQVKGDSK